MVGKPPDIEHREPCLLRYLYGIESEKISSSDKVLLQGRYQMRVSIRWEVW